MAHFQVIQTRNGGDPVVRADGIRRLNGALNIQADLVQNTRDWMKVHSRPGDRVVSGPTGEGDDQACVLAMADGQDFVLVTKIVQK